MNKNFCKGEHCPVKRQCKRYVNGLRVPASSDDFMMSCRNEKMFEKEM